MPCRWSRSPSGRWRSSSSARSGPPVFEERGRTTATGSCARARPPGPPTPPACGCCARTCPSWCPPTSAWSSWRAAATSRRGCSRSTSRRRTSPRARRACGRATARPMLVRNYDYAPSRMEGVIWSTAPAQRRVIGMSDCLWGLLDGMNDAGLAVSLTFGGRRVAGRRVRHPDRRALPAGDVRGRRGARATLARLPYSLSHNLTMVDRAASVLTAYLSPDREPIFREFPAATNHQGIVEWPEQARATRTIERERLHRRPARRPRRRRTRSSTRSCGPRLFSTAYASGFGTLYTAAYRAARGRGGLPLADVLVAPGIRRVRRDASTRRCWPRAPSPEDAVRPDGCFARASPRAMLADLAFGGEGPRGSVEQVEGARSCPWCLGDRWAAHVGRRIAPDVGDGVGRYREVRRGARASTRACSTARRARRPVRSRSAGMHEGRRQDHARGRHRGLIFAVGALRPGRPRARSMGGLIVLAGLVGRRRRALRPEQARRRAERGARVGRLPRLQSAGIDPGILTASSR